MRANRVGQISHVFDKQDSHDCQTAFPLTGS